VLLRLSTAVLLSVSAFSADVSASGGHGAGARAAPATTVPADDSSPPTTLDNPFLPEDANIGDCISAVPRPECGSKARGGWRQGVVFGAVAIAMVVIGTRLVVGVRKRDRARTG
jgi:hypothetical protein